MSAARQGVILRCLAPEPKDRYHEVSEVLTALDGGAVPSSLTSLPPHAARRPTARLVAIAAALVALVVATSVVVGIRLHRRAPSEPTVRARESVAVLPLRNLASRPDVAWLSTALAEMLGSELAVGATLRVVPGDQTARAQLERGEAAEAANAAFDRLGALLGARFVIVGSYAVLSTEADPQIRIDLSLHDAKGDAPVMACSESGHESELFELVARLGTRLRFSLGTNATSTEARRAAYSALPTVPAALRLYAEALSHHRRYDDKGARELAEQAIAQDPQHPLPHLLLWIVWQSLGHTARAKQEAMRARERSASLSEPERLAVEAREREVAHSYQDAARIYERLNRLFPDDLDYADHLVHCQIFGIELDRAERTMERLRRLPAPLRDDPRLDLLEAHIAFARNDGRRLFSASESAAVKGRTIGATQLVAQALRWQATALAWLGEPQRALTVAQESSQRFASIGDLAGQAGATSLIGSARKRLADPEGAREAFRRAEALAREAENLEWLGVALNNHANVELNLGNFAAAIPLYEQSYEIALQEGAADGQALALLNAGEAASDLGQLRLARSYRERALVIARNAHDRYREQLALGLLSNTQSSAGKLRAALELARQAVALNQELGDEQTRPELEFFLGTRLAQLGKLAEARQAFERGATVDPKRAPKRAQELRLGQCAEGLFGVAEAQWELAEAHRNLDTAAALYRGASQPDAVEQTEVERVILLLDERKYAEAVAAARRSTAKLAALHLDTLHGTAERLLAEALLGEHQVGEARAALTRASRLVSPEDVLEQLALATTDASVKAAEGQVAQARRALTAVAAQARSIGAVPLELEALARLYTIHRATRPGQAHRNVEELRRRANELGFRRIADELTRVRSD
jgi:tetratricopeptide (TPR) repeat protein